MSNTQDPNEMSPSELHREARRNIQAAKQQALDTVVSLDNLDEIMAAGEPYWNQIDNTQRIGIIPTSSSAVGVLRNVYQLANQARSDASRFVNLSGTLTVAASAYAAATTTHHAQVFGSPPLYNSDDIHIDFVDVTPVQEVADRFHQHEGIAHRLLAHDPELGKTYEEIRQVLHRTDNPEKPSLFLMRQVFDHLFRLLVIREDEEIIRQTPGRKLPDPNKPKLVTRGERLNYAADKWITNTLTRQVLKASIRNMLDTYDELQRLHNENAIDPQKARAALYSMQNHIEAWTDALGW